VRVVPQTIDRSATTATPLVLVSSIEKVPAGTLAGGVTVARAPAPTVTSWPMRVPGGTPEARSAKNQPEAASPLLRAVARLCSGEID
jgi:hypothetical protein